MSIVAKKNTKGEIVKLIITEEIDINMHDIPDVLYGAISDSIINDLTAIAYQNGELGVFPIHSDSSYNFKLFDQIADDNNYMGDTKKQIEESLSFINVWETELNKCLEFLKKKKKELVQ